MWSHELCPEYWTNTLTYFRYITIKDSKDTFLEFLNFSLKMIVSLENLSELAGVKILFLCLWQRRWAQHDENLRIWELFFSLLFSGSIHLKGFFFLLNSEKCLVIEPTFERKAKTIITQRWLLRTTTILVSNSHVRKITIIFSEQKHSSFFTFFENFTPKNSSKLDIFCCKK
jgi:hypothetical protein